MGDEGGGAGAVGAVAVAEAGDQVRLLRPRADARSTNTSTPLSSSTQFAAITDSDVVSSATVV